MLSLEPFTEDQGRSAVQPTRDPAGRLPCALRVYSPVDSHTCRLLGPCFKTGRMGAHGPTPERAVPRHAVTARAASHDRGDDVSAGISTPGLGPPPQSASVHAPSRSADRLSPFHIRPGRTASPHPLPSRQFQALFDSLFKVLFIFPSRYLFAIGLSPDESVRSNHRGSWRSPRWAPFSASREARLPGGHHPPRPEDRALATLRDAQAGVPSA
ncbi:hypothetical protein K1719_047183 [Acacia pycnantha]|nr:hypothetical protein K1719_047183 [Acacia pycnantha]